MVAVSAAGSMPVSAIAADTVVRIPPDAPLLEVAAVLVEAEISAVVVTAGDDVLGIVSERDLVRAIASHRDLAATHAIDVASTSLVWSDLTATVAEVAAEMMEQYVRHVLLDDNSRLAGIVSARDLLGAYAALDVDV